VTDAGEAAAEVVAALTRDSQTVATAESLTGGLVCAALIAVSGASEVVRGGVVAYAADVKSLLLGVDAGLIARVGTVDAAVAEAMAERARHALSATWGIATTGVAGPDPSEGKDVGTVYVAVAGPTSTVSRRHELSGTRADIRGGTVIACLSLLLGRLEEQSATDRS
jgi:nicotinamide-nucleotide amidase